MWQKRTQAQATTRGILLECGWAPQRKDGASDLQTRSRSRLFENVLNVIAGGCGTDIRPVSALFALFGRLPGREHALHVLSAPGQRTRCAYRAAMVEIRLKEVRRSASSAVYHIVQLAPYRFSRSHDNPYLSHYRFFGLFCEADRGRSQQEPL